MTLRQFLTVLKARKWVVLSVLAVTVGVTVAASAALPTRWAATAAVLVDAKSPDPASGLLVPAQTVPGFMATQVEVIQSRKVALKVVERLKLDQSQAAQQQWRGETQGRGSLKVWLADRLLDRLAVAPANQSSVVNITYTAGDPQSAAAVANAFAHAYAEANLELRAELARQTAQWIAERTLASGQEAQLAPDASPERRPQIGAESPAAQTNIALLSPAVDPIEPSFPRWLLSVALALALGAMLGVSVALIMEKLDQRVRSEGDVANTLQLPLLATLPHARVPRTVRPRLLTHRPQSGS